MKPTITQPHWKDRKWEYIPAADHADSSKFKERMEMRRRAVQQQPVPNITERKS